MMGKKGDILVYRCNECSEWIDNPCYLVVVNVVPDGAEVVNDICVSTYGRKANWEEITHEEYCEELKKTSERFKDEG